MSPLCHEVAGDREPETLGTTGDDGNETVDATRPGRPWRDAAPVFLGLPVLDEPALLV